jgi:hypothetical protein
VRTRGGNALLGMRLKCRVLERNKRMAYVIVTIHGDAVKLEDKY